MLLTYPREGEAEAGFLAELEEAERWADCILIGPGIGTGERAHELLRFALLKSALPLVIDADGINLLAGDGKLQSAMADREGPERTIILTPHPGEFAGIFGGTVREAKEGLLRHPGELAERLHCVVVCKDARTVVVQPGGGHRYLNTTGNCGMATAGSGDVLAGMITGLLAQGMAGMEAAVTGVYLHGCAGDLAAALKTETAMTATDLLDCIAEAVRLHGRAAARNTEVTIC